jgi:hypothetical protein
MGLASALVALGGMELGGFAIWAMRSAVWGVLRMVEHSGRQRRNTEAFNGLRTVSRRESRSPTGKGRVRTWQDGRGRGHR